MSFLVRLFTIELLFLETLGRTGEPPIFATN